MPARRSSRPFVLLLASALLAGLAATPAAAQESPAASPVASAPAAATIKVTATDYHFGGLPTSVPAGTSFSLVNEGTEVHELVIVRRDDDTTESWDEILALPPDQALTRITLVGQLIAAPGTTAEGTLAVDQEGTYLAACFVPQGTTEMPEMPDPEASGAADSTPPPGLGDGPPHWTLGMRQEFAVTAPGTTPGPLPSVAPSMGASMAPAESASPADADADADARTVELELTSALQIVQDGQQVTSLNVAVGETIRFVITNTAGFEHNFYIGPPDVLSVPNATTEVGVPTFAEGTQEFTWTVPENAADLEFACTFPGHYTLMKGTFVVGG